MTCLKNKGLEEHMKRIIVEKNSFGFNITPISYSNPVDGVSFFWEDLINKDIEVKKIIGFNGSYGLQLYSEKGPAYIDEQLKELGEQLNA